MPLVDPARAHRLQGFHRGRQAEGAFPIPPVHPVPTGRLQVEGGRRRKHSARISDPVSRPGGARNTTMATNDPTFAEHRAGVEVGRDRRRGGKAHNSMSALKIPKGDPADKALPRFRSSVSGDDVATRAARRDRDEETDKVRDKPVTSRSPASRTTRPLSHLLGDPDLGGRGEDQKARLTFGERHHPGRQEARHAALRRRPGHSPGQCGWQRQAGAASGRTPCSQRSRRDCPGAVPGTSADGR